MSIAALMVDLDDLPSYTQEDTNDHDVDTIISDAVFTMECDSRDIDTLDHAISSLTDIQMSLESDGDLSAEATKYLGLALDAAMGKSQTLFVGGMSFKTRNETMSLEAFSDVKGKGAIKVITEMVKVAYAKLKSIFMAAVNFIAGFLIKKRRLDKALNKAVDVLKYYGPAKEVTISKSIHASLGGAGVKDTSGIIRLLKNFMESTAHVAHLSEEFFKLTSAAFLENGHLTPADMIKMGNLTMALHPIYTEAKKGLPGNQSVVMIPFSDTVLGSVITKLPMMSNVKEDVTYAKTVGIRPDTEIKMPGATQDELREIADIMKVIGEQIGTLDKLTKSKHWLDITKIELSDNGIRSNDDQSFIDRFRNEYAFKRGLAMSPATRYPAELLKEASRIYEAGVKLILTNISQKR